MPRLTAMWRMRRLSSALLPFGLSMATAIALTPSSGATPGYDAGPTPSSGAPQPSSAPPVSWGSCGKIISNPRDGPRAQCGSVAVPVDYANPGGAQVHIAVIRIPATGPRIGALLVNPGGPGASAVDMVATMGADLAGLDPRGVGRSTPGVRCQTDAEFDAYRREPMVDYSPQGVAHIEQVYRQ